MPFNNFFKRNKPQAQPPAPPSASEPVAVSPWRAQNQETLDELARFIDFAEGFTLGFLEINFEDDLDEVLKALRTRRECTTAQFHVFNFDDPDLRFLKDALEAKIQQLPPPVSLLMDEQRVMFVKGLENAIGLFGDYPPVLQDLNFVRDAWIESVRYPVLFCLPSYAINRIIKFAPDFWSWKSGLFRILSSQEREDEAAIYALHARKAISSASQLERQERIKLLEKLAQEFDPLQANRSKADLRIAAQALTELGIVQSFAGEYLKANEALTLVAQVLDKPEWLPETSRDLTLRIKYLTWYGYVEHWLGRTTSAEARLQKSLSLNDGVDAGLKSIACSYLGYLKADQGEVDAAIALYRQSLDIKERIGHAQGKATTLQAIGRLKADQGEVDAASALYQKSLDIFERIDFAQGKAMTLQAIGRLKADQGEVDAAITLYQKSLDIYERSGYVQGKAATLRELANVKVMQGELETAASFYQEALRIFERKSTALGKAKTLWQYGEFLADKKGDFETAVAYLQESLSIFQKIGSPDAAKVQTLCDRIQSQVYNR
ncbi:MAG: tetratricopeptide repeat protein [Cyanobacteria bacterium P01_H01_bin.119]